jgi:hypothetical protein
MPPHKKNTLLKNAQANAASNFFKRVFFLPTQKSTLPFFTNSFFPTHELTCNLTMTASKINPFGQRVCKFGTTHFLTDRRATDNSTYKKLAVQCSADTFAVNQTWFSASTFMVKIANFL